jgi:hypothetical protein
MQINSSNTLPAITGLRPQTSPRQSAGSTPTSTRPEPQTNLDQPVDSQREYYRAPVFIQPMTGIKMSRHGEEALRTYREVAMAGDEAELVNRVNVTA